ncbi:MAG: hypothetical protein RLZZ28_1834 [Bacteroidota bacterium]|jgi:O-antigen ligase
MIESITIKGTIAEKITYHHLQLFAMTLPFDRFYSEIVLISLILHSLIQFSYSNTKKMQWRIWLLPGSIYLLTLLGTLYTKYPGEAFSEWERQLALLLFPFILSINTFDFRKYAIPIIKWMGISCFFVVIYLYMVALWSIHTNQLPLQAIFSASFLNHNFSAPIGMHATYFSMYILLSLVVFIAQFPAEKRYMQKAVLAIIILVLTIGLIQLSSRAVLIALGICLNIIFPLALVKKGKRLKALLITSIVSLMLLTTISSIETVSNKMFRYLKEDITKTQAVTNNLEPRIARWECGWQLVKNAPVYGNGSGSEVALLKEIFYQKKLYQSFLNDLNVHNQYLSMLIKTGIVGLFVLLWVYLTGIMAGLKNNDFAILSFLVICMVVSFSENILDANKGVFFFSFFYCLLMVDYLGSTGSKTKLLQ